VHIFFEVFSTADSSKGIEFQELVILAEHIVTFCHEPKVLLPIFAEIPRLILG